MVAVPSVMSFVIWRGNGDGCLRDVWGWKGINRVIGSEDSWVARAWGRKGASVEMGERKGGSERDDAQTALSLVKWLSKFLAFP